MKRILSLLALAGSLTSAVNAGTLSGNVYYINSTQPVAGQVITIADTLNNWNTTVTTDAAGHYSITIPSNVPTTTPGNQINLSTVACGQWQRVIAINSGNPTANFYVCTGSGSSYTLHGTVSLSGAANTDTSIVYVIRKAYNPTLMDTTLTAIDSIYTDITGAYSRTYSAIPSGTIFVKAALLLGHPNYSTSLPTYYTSSLSWTGATALGAGNFVSAATNINLISGTNPGGPAFVGGSVVLGANKTSGVGDPLPKRILILTKSTGEAIAYTYSDAAGKFQFPSLPYGSYKLFGDALGKTNPVLSFTLSATQSRIANIVFEENSKKFEGRFVGVGVPGTALEALSVFPNPATTSVQVRGLGAIQGSKTVVLSTMTGAVISHQVVESGDPVISTASMPAGVYMLQVETALGKVSFRIVK